MPLRRELRLALIPLFVLFVTFAVYWREFLTRSSYGYNSEVNVPEPPINPTKPTQQTNEEYGDKEDPRICIPSPSTTVKEQKPLQPHVWRDDGLLEVNPDGAHPILELIDKAQKKWEDKKARASTTLRQAVKEYERRYNRKPPAGFDKWWDYVEKHSVQLPDEYDQIWRDIEPFWGYSPSDLQRIQSERETHQESFTLGKNETNGLIHVLRVAFPEHMQWEPEALLGGARSIQEILKDVQAELPLFRAVISPHDSPTLFTDFDVKKAALFAAARGEHLDVNNLPAAPRLGWLSGCGPKSPAREHSALQTDRKTFIHDHLKVMDPCVHPEVFELQGEFLVHPDPVPEKLLIPQFAFCSTKMHHDIQIPTLSGWIDDINPREDDPDWDDKEDERMNWRGSNTGMWHAPHNRWRESQRARLVDFAAGLNGTVKVLIPPKSDKAPVGEGKELQKAAINPAIFDIAFSGEPVGCHADTCPELLKIYEWRKKHGQKDSGRFKYIVDVDGNAWSSRFKRLITTNSLIFKATVYPEWFYDRIEPWVHYVPIQVDYSDVHDALTFFRGGMYGEGAHHDLAKKIAVEGRNWSRTLWRREDVTAYIYRLILEYARVMNSDREAMSYHG